MWAVKWLRNVRSYYNEINPATLTGAIDIVVVEQEDGSYLSSPFHVRFGKTGVIRSKEKVVYIEINGESVDLFMKLGESGEAFFVEEVDDPANMPAHLVTSPIQSSYELTDTELEELIGGVVGESLPIPGADVAGRENPATIVGGVDIIPKASDFHGVPMMSHSVSDFPSQRDAENEFLGAAFARQSQSFMQEPIFESMSVPKSASLQSDGYFKPIGCKPGTFSEGGGSRFGKANDDHVPVASFMIGTPNSRPKSRSARNQSSSLVPRQSVEEDKDCQTDEEEEGDIFDMDSDKCDDDDEETPSQLPPRRLVTSQTSSSARASSMPPLSHRRRVDESQSQGAIHQPPDVDVSQSGGGSHTPKISVTQFNDTELSPSSSPLPARRACSPKSDTEFELPRNDRLQECSSSEAVNQWPWGELPSTVTVTAAASAASKVVSRAPNDGMDKAVAKGLKDKAALDAIYLDDFNPEEMDPEIAALYFPKSVSSDPSMARTDRLLAEDVTCVREEDCESGHGASLPESPSASSPTTVPEAEPTHTDSSLSPDDKEAGHHHMYNPEDISFSLCGGLQSFSGISIPAAGGVAGSDADNNNSSALIPPMGAAALERFEKHKVSYEDFCKNPALLSSSDLVVRIRDRFYNFHVASPMIWSMVAFSRPLNPEAVRGLRQKHMPERRTWSSWWSSKKLVDPKSASPPAASPAGETSLTGIEGTAPLQPETELAKSTVSERSVAAAAAAAVDSGEEGDDEAHGRESESVGSPGEGQSGGEQPVDRKLGGGQTGGGKEKVTKEPCRKTLKLSPAQLAKLNLHEGSNEIEFSVTTSYQGTTRCISHIYLWKHTDKIIISDIDGTITKSDVLGQILPMVGKDWSQTGVTELYNKITANGYKFAYLSARAIGQAHTTRDYLRSVKQGELTLPPGPVFLNPSSLMNAFHREVIEKTPEKFKIHCLRSIKDLFPPSPNPFYAGFGNRINDVWAYRAVDIPSARIFTINHKGELRNEISNTFQSSYADMSSIVDHFFPPCCTYVHRSAGHSCEHMEYSSVTYWRDPMPQFDLVDELSS